MRVCSGAGCLRAVLDDVRFCAECQEAWAASKPVDDGIRKHGRVTESTLAVADRDVFAFLYSSHRWQRLRAVFVKAHPFCAGCDLGLAQIVDHTVPAAVVIVQAQASGLWPGDTYAGFYLKSNLQSLCRRCHGRKTEADKAHVGVWDDAIAKELSQVKTVWSFG